MNDDITLQDLYYLRWCNHWVRGLIDAEIECYTLDLTGCIDSELL